MKNMTREQAMAELEHRANSPLLCWRSYDLPVSFAEYRAAKAKAAAVSPDKGAI